MKEKGFTLIELLGVLVVLALILVVAVPAVTSSLKNTDKAKYSNFVEEVISSAELYIEENRNLFPELNEIGGVVTIKVGKLIDFGYLKENTVNPKTNQKIERTEEIRITVNEDYTFYYEYPLS